MTEDGERRRRRRRRRRRTTLWFAPQVVNRILGEIPEPSNLEN
jgi:hypothetical protein